MGVFSRWLDSQVRKAAKAAQMNIFSYSGVAIYPDSDIQELIEKAFEENIHVYSIIRRIVKKFASPPRYIYKDKKDRNPISNELSKLMETPNDFQGADQFWESCILQYMLTGETFIRLNRGGIENGRVVELEVYPSQIVELIPDPANINGVLGYKLDFSGQKVFVSKDDMIHWRTANPNFDASTREHLRGFNPLKPQRRTFTMSNSAIDAQVAMMENGGARGAFYNETLDDLTPEQASQLKRTIDRGANGKSNKGSVFAMQGKWGYLDLGASSIDMQLLDTDEHTLKALCNANGIPYELFQSDTTFANKEQALVYYVTNELMPTAFSLDSILTRKLAPIFGGNVVIRTDFSELPEMATLNAKLVEAASKAYWKTLNEKRIMTNDEPIKKEGMDEVWLPAGYVSLTQANEPIMPDLEIEEDM